MSMLRVILLDTQREVVLLCSAIPNTLDQANHLRPLDLSDRLSVSNGGIRKPGLHSISELQ
uniref:Uncharacterized protein n=1 Tax=Utricularia reniformis TaxID=192314 RepID=A0A1Y0AZM4_9LAMI|nr:hypothetical protein AEK19_MT0360 [Utricularia reniformis]ART30632.1 hypothetical protein AEK19_MT0360 [Utricularia reniformis]